VSTDGGDEAIWARNGEIFYRSGTRMMAVPVETSPALRIGRPQLLFESAYVPTGPSGRANYDVAADGQRLLMISNRCDGRLVASSADPGRTQLVRGAEAARARTLIPRA
jgi:hypothetical protein